MESLSNPTLYEKASSPEEFQANVTQVYSRIKTACDRVGRDPASVRLLPVSKTVEVARVRIAYAAGLHTLGENKAQEGFQKWEEMSDCTDLKWAVIGHLQTNKAKLVAKFASEFHALDSVRVAAALDARLQAEGRGMDVLIQVNTSGEASKYGLQPEEVRDFLRELPAFSSLRIRGLMTLALFSPDTQRVRACFIMLRELRDHLRQAAPQGIDLEELSMGMSGDFEIAVEEGATVVRVGQAIFGSRPGTGGAYWPGAGLQTPV